MQKLKEKAARQHEEEMLNQVIYEISKDAENQKILKAGQLKGRKPSMPLDINKFHQVYAFKKLEKSLNNVSENKLFQQTVK